MRQSHFTLPSRAVPVLLMAIVLGVSGLAFAAQQAAPSHPYYDVRQEITLRGQISSVLQKAPGGSHLMLSTSTGLVDASLGRWGMQGKGAISAQVGQQIEATGVLKTLAGKQVFIVRTLKVGGRTYLVRNEHGIPVSPQSRERIAQKGASR